MTPDEGGLPRMAAILRGFRSGRRIGKRKSRKYQRDIAIALNRCAK
jgi:hypothetical protein